MLAVLEIIASGVAFLGIGPNGGGTIEHDLTHNAANQEDGLVGALHGAGWWRWAWSVAHLILELVHFGVAFVGSFSGNALQFSVVLVDVLQVCSECIDVHLVVLIAARLIEDARDVALIVEKQRERVREREMYSYPSIGNLCLLEGGTNGDDVHVYPRRPTPFALLESSSIPCISHLTRVWRFPAEDNRNWDSRTSASCCSRHPLGPRSVSQLFHYHYSFNILRFVLCFSYPTGEPNDEH